MQWLWPKHTEVLIMSHEASRMTDMEDYLRKKFAPIQPMFMIGRSYKMDPICKPKFTLYDAWTELLLHSPYCGMLGGGW